MALYSNGNRLCFRTAHNWQYMSSIYMSQYLSAQVSYVTGTVQPSGLNGCALNQYPIKQPPSMDRFWPVMKLAARSKKPHSVLENWSQRSLTSCTRLNSLKAHQKE